MALDRPKRAKMATILPKTAPRGHTRAKEAFKMAEDGPKIAPRGGQEAQDKFKMAPRGL